MRFPANRSGGHSLPELLVAVAVLALLVILIFQATQEVLNVTNSQEKKINAVASGRRLLDVMTVDLENALIGPDATVLAPNTPGNDIILAMLCNRRAPSPARTARFLAVKYSLDSGNRVFRSYGAVGFSQTNLLDASLNASTNLPAESAVPLAAGILAIQARAHTATTNYPASSGTASGWAVTNTYQGHVVPAGYNALVTASSASRGNMTNCTKALEISVAAVDSTGYALIRSFGYLDGVRAVLAGDPVGWRSGIDSLTMPSRFKSAIRIFQKTTPLP